MAFKTYTVSFGQTLADLSIQLYGDESHILQIVQDNPDIGDINNYRLQGMVINYTDPNLSLTNYFKINKIIINTGNSNTPITVTRGWASVSFSHGWH